MILKPVEHVRKDTLLFPWFFFFFLCIVELINRGIQPALGLNPIIRSATWYSDKQLKELWLSCPEGVNKDSLRHFKL